MDRTDDTYGHRSACRKVSPWLGIAALCLALAGCAHYEYEIIQPAVLAQHVGASRDVVFDRDSVQYRMRSVENLLLIRIYNLGAERLRLLPDQSYAVDQWGQSHPLAGQTIGPHSYIRLVLPPQPPDYWAGPAFGIGMGGWLWPPLPPVGYGFYSPYGVPPPQYAVYDNGNYYWSWTDQGDVRLELAFQRDDQKPFTHPFVFHRRKM